MHYPFFFSAGYQCPDYNDVAKISWLLYTEIMKFKSVLEALRNK